MKSTDQKAAHCAEALNKGHIIAYPTETVWGLGVDARIPEAIVNLNRAKNRAPGNPYSILLGNKQSILEYVSEIPDCAHELIEKYLPGPLTIIFPSTGKLPDVLTGGRNTVGIRVSALPELEELFSHFQGPLITTSANISGKPACTSEEEIRSTFGPRIADILPCQSDQKTISGTPSTVVSVVSNKIEVLRQGSLHLETGAIP